MKGNHQGCGFLLGEKAEWNHTRRLSARSCSDILGETELLHSHQAKRILSQGRGDQFKCSPIPSSCVVEYITAAKNCQPVSGLINLSDTPTHPHINESTCAWNSNKHLFFIFSVSLEFLVSTHILCTVGNGNVFLERNKAKDTDFIPTGYSSIFGQFLSKNDKTHVIAISYVRLNFVWAHWMCLWDQVYKGVSLVYCGAFNVLAWV